MPKPSVDDDAFHSRAVPTDLDNLYDDPDVMVHQQLARLDYFVDRIGARGKLLEFGSGTGFNCGLLARQGFDVSGFDFSEGAVALAKSNYPEISFMVADACLPTLDLGQFDRIVAFEVLEHVPDQSAFIRNIGRHLKDNGVAFISTPNRPVFSLNYVPSPMNREHIAELDLEQFRALLEQYFSTVKIVGQRFKDKQLLKAWHFDVSQKADALARGKRWVVRPESVTHKYMRSIYSKLPLLQSAWRWWKYGVLKRRADERLRKSRPYKHSDFEFSSQMDDALWLCAEVRNPRRGQ